jgi:polyhydroxybutyrate depolymerase
MKAGLAIVFAAGLLAAPASSTGLRSEGTVMHWTIDGVQRDAIVFAPRPTAAAVEHPLVIAFHGHGGNMQGTSQLMHFQTLWPQAIVVYPQGLNTVSPHDPTGSKPGWQDKSGDDGDRDLKLFDAIVASMDQKYGVDKRRVYATGFSNGGVFSYLLWATRAKTIAAVGEVAGRLDPAETLTVPRALLAVAGRHDVVDPFVLQQQSIEAARQVDGATGTGLQCGLYCTLYASGATPVKTFIHPDGHVYPPWAPAQIVTFFRAHPRP